MVQDFVHPQGIGQTTLNTRKQGDQPTGVLEACIGDIPSGFGLGMNKDGFRWFPSFGILNYQDPFITKGHLGLSGAAFNDWGWAVLFRISGTMHTVRKLSHNLTKSFGLKSPIPRFLLLGSLVSGCQNLI